MSLYFYLQFLLMEPLTHEQLDTLYTYAQLAAAFTYSPYSHFAVGAAVLTANGSIFTGTNIENASYGLTICAERVALGNAISNGHTTFKAIAVHSPVKDITPCGACRQFIVEFGNKIIVIFKQDGVLVTKTIAELLPDSFDKHALE